MMRLAARPGVAVSPEIGPPLRVSEAVPLNFEAVYEKEVDFLWRTVRRLGVPESALADAVQDVLVIVHRQLDTYERRAPLRNWLAGICVRVARREYRTRRTKHPELLPQSTSVDVDSLHDTSSLDPLDAASRRDAIRLLYDILGTLDPDKREVFVLAELEQLSGPEMLEVLELPLNTIYSRLRAARQQFDRALSIRRAQMRRAP